MAGDLERGFRDGLTLGRKIIGLPFALLAGVMLLVGIIVLRWALIFNRWSISEGDDELAQLLNDWAD